MSPETRQNSETNTSSVIKIASPVLKDLAFRRACSNELNNKDQLVGTNSNQVGSWQHPTQSPVSIDMPGWFSHEAKCKRMGKKSTKVDHYWTSDSEHTPIKRVTGKFES